MNISATKSATIQGDLPARADA